MLKALWIVGIITTQASAVNDLGASRHLNQRSTLLAERMHHQQSSHLAGRASHLSKRAALRSEENADAVAVAEEAAELRAVAKEAAELRMEEEVNQLVEIRAHMALESMVTRMLELDGDRPNMHEVLGAVGDKVNIEKVAQRLENKNLPGDVMSLVKTVAEDQHGDNKKSHEPYDETSLAKARQVLNEMIQSSMGEMDSKIIDCQTFKEANRATFDQINTDMARLGEQVADLERMKLEANNGISAVTEHLHEVKADIKDHEENRIRQLALNQAEMRTKQADLEVFQFVLEFTRCSTETEGVLLQDHKKPSQASTTRICEKGNRLMIDFGDKVKQAKYESMMTPTARREIEKVLGMVNVRDVQGASFVQLENRTTTFPPVQSATSPVDESPGEDAAYRCHPTPPDCGLLHDKMSLLWGEFKDQMDELQFTMDQNSRHWEELKDSFMQQIKILTNSLNTFSAQLAEATANMNADHEEQRAKLNEKHQLESDYQSYMGKCKARIEWILFQDICAVIVVRNALLVDSSVCPTSGIVDCDVENWMPSQCTVSCDDDCPHPDDPFQCGGWQTLSRRIVVPPNACGLACPELTYQKKCNQIKCPIDCIMSEWSDYSKCTKDCEGGVQQRTRDVMTNAKNGGQWCEAPTEQRACNTGSCDRDCVLSDWSGWTPCSMACTPADSDPGSHKRVREVIVPTRGEGECPLEESSFRTEHEECNTIPCTGDEDCYAVQDLVIAIDGSGSIVEEDFDVLKQFVVRLLHRYKGNIGGNDLMKVGIVQFGNGYIRPDGTVNAALKIKPLTSDMEEVKQAVEGMQHLRGFTNMAQALVASENMFSESGRGPAQSAIMVITDGKPSFTFQTQQKVNDLEDKGIQRFFVTISDHDGFEVEMMKKWASAPWYSNFVHIPGFEALWAANGTYVQEVIVHFCPMSESPTVCHAILYQHGNFGGWHADFPEGAYDMNAMTGKGAMNDDLSALKVFGAGCVATLYQHWDFTGYSVDFPEGFYSYREYLRQGARNDDISSIRVEKLAA